MPLGVALTSVVVPAARLRRKILSLAAGKPGLRECRGAGRERGVERVTREIGRAADEGELAAVGTEDGTRRQGRRTADRFGVAVTSVVVAVVRSRMKMLIGGIDWLGLVAEASRLFTRREIGAVGGQVGHIAA